MLDLIERIIKESQEADLDGYYKYVDPKVKHRTWETPLNASGFVQHRDPNTMYTDKNGPDPEHTKAHEFEHTQQLKSGQNFKDRTTKDFSDRWSLSKELYPYQPKVGNDHPLYSDLTGEQFQQIHSSPKEFLADLAGLFKHHQDPEIRKKIENILKSRPEYYSLLQKQLYPTMNHTQSTDSPSTPINPARSLIDQARQWMRNKTAY